MRHDNCAKVYQLLMRLHLDPAQITKGLWTWDYDIFTSKIEEDGTIFGNIAMAVCTVELDKTVTWVVENPTEAEDLLSEFVALIEATSLFDAPLFDASEFVDFDKLTPDVVSKAWYKFMKSEGKSKDHWNHAP